MWITSPLFFKRGAYTGIILLILKLFYMIKKLFSQKNTAGFTLIELLVVIAIIGVLASVVLASLNTARKKSRDARRIADIKQIQLALELYFDANRAYPATLSPLAPTYIPTVPTDPLGSAYSYADCTDDTRYHLGATLEDTTNPALSSDRDGNSTAAGNVCGTSAAASGGFDGTAAAVYDVAP